ncbi:MAG: insulinase family protein [Magnetococcales bacterium]|nr:insulinase family protein [Magnetococcales bacterium]
MNRRRWQWVGLLLSLWIMGFQLALATERDKIRQFSTTAGAGVILIENHVNPMVEVRILVRGGSAYDPSDRAGVAYMTAWMFNEGAGELNSTTFQERLHYYGISLAANAHQDTLEISMTTLSEHLEEAWTRLGESLTQPRLDPVDFQRGVRERVAELMKSEEEPAFRAGRALYPLIYGDHPYARPVNGNPESIQKITLADIRRHHIAAFRGPGMVIAVAGDVTLEKLQELTTRHLAKLNPLPGQFPPIPQAVTGKKGVAHHIEMDLPQTTLRLGVVGISRDDPDFYAMTVMNQILGGGGLTSRLTNSIREQRGLAYGIFSHFSPLSGRGPFQISTETKTESASEALSLIRQELTHLTRERVGEEELRDVKRYLTGSFPLQLDGLDKLAESWSRIVFYQRGLDYLDKWPERIRAVTQKDIQRVSRRILEIKRFNVVTVGKQKPELANGDDIRP